MTSSAELHDQPLTHLNLAADTGGGERRRSEAARTAGARVRLMARPAYMCGAAGRSAEVRPRRQQVRYWRPQPAPRWAWTRRPLGTRGPVTRPGERSTATAAAPGVGLTWVRDSGLHLRAMGN